VGQGATKSTGIADRRTNADGEVETEISPDGPGGLPRLALHHSPEALRWVRRQRGWTKADLARASGLAESTIRGLENGSRSAGPVALAKLAEALVCPQVVLEAGQINAVATSAVSALDLLVGLLRISDPAYVTRRGGFVRLGFVASGRNIGTLRVQEDDFGELVAALRRHFPSRRGPHQHTRIARPTAHPTTDDSPDSSTDIAAPKG
jgi:transcriptional regulator with XRE-family HTH domain